MRAGDTLDTVPVVAAMPGEGEVVTLAPSDLAADAATPTTTGAPTTTTTEAPPTTVVARTAPPPTTAPAPKPPARPTTTTTAAPKREPAPAPAAEGTELGKASWYDHQPGVCAHKSLPFGTVVTVTHTGNGRSTTCTVGDRGPFVEGRIIDLHPEQFEDLAPRSTGVIPVRISW